MSALRQTYRFLRACPRPAARLGLGLFILWQLFFLLAQNFLDLARETRQGLPEEVKEVVEAVAPGWTLKTGHVHDAVEAVMTWTERWSRLTGQPQGWELFAPDVTADCAFPLVELRWEEPPPAPWEVPGLLALLAAGRPLETAALAAALPQPSSRMAHAAELVPSENEPADPHHFLRLGRFRLRRYETYLGILLISKDGETAAQQKARWRDEIEYYLRQEGETVRAYLRWRMEAYLRAHPDRPAPRQVVLYVRHYHILPPEERNEGPWSEPDTTLQARWRPALVGAAAYLPVEAYNPVTGSFQWLAQPEGTHGP